MMTDSPACIYRVLDQNTQEFIMTESSRRAVDEMLSIMQSRLENLAKNGLKKDSITGTLVDSQVGVQPLNYAFIRLKPLLNEYPSIRGARIAMIVPQGPLLRTIATMMRTIGTVRFYNPGARDQALAWLHEGADVRSKR